MSPCFRFGRKPLILWSGPFCIVGWVLVLATRESAVIYVVRVLHGAAVGIVYTVCPMYIAEIAEPRIRGELSGQFQTMWYMGVVYAYIVGAYLEYQR
jgi:SP family facilitated glucose transporter-like MFS transporter 8